MTRPYKRGRGQRCSKCDAERKGKDRYCDACRAAYNRIWRKGQTELLRRLKRIIKNVSCETMDDAPRNGVGG